MKIRMSIHDYFRSVAAILGDDEPNRPFQRYALHDLIVAYNLGMTIIYKYRPDLFVEIKNIKLQPGNRQDTRHICDNVLRVLEQTDSVGNVIKEVNTAKTTMESGSPLSSWQYKRNIARYIDNEGNEAAYIMSHAQIDNTTNGLFTVYPAVPIDIDVFVNVKAVVEPIKIIDDKQQDTMPNSDFHNAVIQDFILYRMLVGDRFAAGALQEAQMHFNNFINLLQLEHQQEILSEIENATVSRQR